MRSGLLLLFVLFLLLAGTLYFILQAGIDIPFLSPALARSGYQPERWPTIFQAWEDYAPKKFVPPEYQSGTSRFSRGQCVKDDDCIVTGCSSEVCATQELTTSCDLGYDFPNAQNYTCGCVNRVCGWSKE